MYKRVDVCEIEGFCDEWPGDNLIKFMAWVNQKVDGIPLEHRGNAKIEIGAYDDHGGPTPSIEIYYWIDDGAE